MSRCGNGVPISGGTGLSVNNDVDFNGYRITSLGNPINDQDAIDDEESARISADAVLTSSIATEVTNRATAVSSEAATRAAADTSLQSQIDTEKGRVDGILAGSSVNLDSFLEVVNQYTSLNTDALAQIASLNTALVALTARVDELTSSP